MAEGSAGAPAATFVWPRILVAPSLDDSTAPVAAGAPLRIYAATWNMHGQTPPSDVSALIPARKYHLYAIGTQECERGIGASLLWASKERWERVVRSAIGPGYVRVGSQTLAALHLVVYAHASLAARVSDVQVGAVACGLANRVGNKGGVAVGFRLAAAPAHGLDGVAAGGDAPPPSSGGATHIAFVNCHLAAHQGGVATRLRHARRIDAALPLVPSAFGAAARRGLLTSLAAPGSAAIGVTALAAHLQQQQQQRGRPVPPRRPSDTSATTARADAGFAGFVSAADAPKPLLAVEPSDAFAGSATADVRTDAVGAEAAVDGGNNHDAAPLHAEASATEIVTARGRRGVANPSDSQVSSSASNAGGGDGGLGDVAVGDATAMETERRSLDHSLTQAAGSVTTGVPASGRGASLGFRGASDDDDGGGGGGSSGSLHARALRTRRTDGSTGATTTGGGTPSEAPASTARSGAGATPRWTLRAGLSFFANGRRAHTPGTPVAPATATARGPAAARSRWRRGSERLAASVGDDIMSTGRRSGDATPLGVTTGRSTVRGGGNGGGGDGSGGGGGGRSEGTDRHRGASSGDFPVQTVPAVAALSSPLPRRADPRAPPPSALTSVGTPYSGNATDDAHARGGDGGSDERPRAMWQLLSPSCFSCGSASSAETPEPQPQRVGAATVPPTDSTLGTAAASQRASHDDARGSPAAVGGADRGTGAVPLDVAPTAASEYDSEEEDDELDDDEMGGVGADADDAVSTTGDPPLPNRGDSAPPGTLAERSAGVRRRRRSSNRAAGAPHRRSSASSGAFAAGASDESAAAAIVYLPLQPPPPPPSSSLDGSELPQSAGAAAPAPPGGGWLSRMFRRRAGPRPTGPTLPLRRASGGVAERDAAAPAPFVNSLRRPSGGAVATAARQAVAAVGLRAVTSLARRLHFPERLSDRYDAVVWMGDLNFRVNGTRPMVDRLLAESCHEVLWANDQLRLERAAGRVLRGFSEGPVTFRPTYKYDRASDAYATGPAGRIPAWTDRILYKAAAALGPGALTLMSYWAVDELRSSDHRPVAAAFELRVPAEFGNGSGPDATAVPVPPSTTTAATADAPSLYSPRDIAIGGAPASSVTSHLQDLQRGRAAGAGARNPSVGVAPAITGGGGGSGRQGSADASAGALEPLPALAAAAAGDEDDQGLASTFATSSYRGLALSLTGSHLPWALPAGVTAVRRPAAAAGPGAAAGGHDPSTSSVKSVASAPASVPHLSLRASAGGSPVGARSVTRLLTEDDDATADGARLRHASSGARPLGATAGVGGFGSASDEQALRATVVPAVPAHNARSQHGVGAPPPPSSLLQPTAWLSTMAAPSPVSPLSPLAAPIRVGHAPAAAFDVPLAPAASAPIPRRHSERDGSPVVVDGAVTAGPPTEVTHPATPAASASGADVPTHRNVGGSGNIATATMTTQAGIRALHSTDRGVDGVSVAPPPAAHDETAIPAALFVSRHSTMGARADPASAAAASGASSASGSAGARSLGSGSGTYRSRRGGACVVSGGGAGAEPSRRHLPMVPLLADTTDAGWTSRDDDVSIGAGDAPLLPGATSLSPMMSAASSARRRAPLSPARAPAPLDLLAATRVHAHSFRLIGAADAGAVAAAVMAADPASAAAVESTTGFPDDANAGSGAARPPSPPRVQFAPLMLVHMPAPVTASPDRRSFALSADSPRPTARPAGDVVGGAAAGAVTGSVAGLSSTGGFAAGSFVRSGGGFSVAGGSAPHSASLFTRPAGSLGSGSEAGAAGVGAHGAARSSSSRAPSVSMRPTVHVAPLSSVSDAAARAADGDAGAVGPPQAAPQAVARHGLFAATAARSGVSYVSDVSMGSAREPSEAAAGAAGAGGAVPLR